MRFSDSDLQGAAHGRRFCNQFLLGPEFVEALDGWQRFDVCCGLKLMAHPQLNVEQWVEGDRSLTVIGYLLDPYAPRQQNRQVLQGLMSRFTTIESLIAETARMGGRWVLIATRSDRATLFNDALGLRQVFYTVPGYRDGLWVMSQPGLLGWLKQLAPDPAARAFFDSYAVRSNPEHRMPGSATVFADVRHLLPNHSLDLATGDSSRYWPTRVLPERSLESGLAESIELLEGLMAALDSRFDWVLGLTAGYDSRVALAAAKALRQRLTAITVRQGDMPDTHQDIVVSARMAREAGIGYEVLHACPYMSGAFSRLFKENVFMAHDRYGPDAEAILDYSRATRVVVTGSGAEVAREPFRKRIDPNKARYTVRDLAFLQGMDDQPFLLAAFQDWLDGFDQSGPIHVLDLFSWEQSHGNWLAATQLEFDIAWRDIFTPFNCRALLECLLSVDRRYRGAPDYPLFQELIVGMWPELLREPINPDTRHRPAGVVRSLCRKTSKAVRHLFG
jgi:hypothetical protein